MKTKPKKLNVRLLRRIQKYILKEPRRFFMDWYYEHSADPKQWKVKSECYSDLAKTMPRCKTAACIAGWACILAGKREQAEADEQWADIARKELNYWGTDLFISNSWPSPFDLQYSEAKTPKQPAKIACARIDWLIKTGE